MNIYLSGPVTGLTHDTAVEAFNAAEAKVLALCPTADIFNPVKHVSPEYEENYATAMQVCLTALSSPDKPIDVVVQLPNWRRSRGATLEASIAATLNIPCILVDSNRLKRVLSDVQIESEKRPFIVHVEVDHRMRGFTRVCALTAEDACAYAQTIYDADPTSFIESLEIQDCETTGIRFSA